MRTTFRASEKDSTAFVGIPGSRIHDACQSPSARPVSKRAGVA
jgi:hypothetical protein